MINYLRFDDHSLLLTDDAYFFISLTALSAVPQEVVSITVSITWYSSAYSIIYIYKNNKKTFSIK